MITTMQRHNKFGIKLEMKSNSKISIKKRFKKDIYISLKEASKAAIALNIKKESEYRIRYKEDPKLPAHPYRYYASDWSCWQVFFGTGVDKYRCYQEASKAAVKLKIKTHTEYRKRYREDPKLTSRPEVRYAIQWVSWNAFLGFTAKYYLTYIESSNAVFKLKIASHSEYLKRYKEDSKLHGTPQILYPTDWINWGNYLQVANSKYQNIQQASDAAIHLGIRSPKEYKIRFKEDSMLPSMPSRSYSEKWTIWKEFLRTGVASYDEYIDASNSAIKLKIVSGSDYLSRHIEDKKLPLHPEKKYKEFWKGWNFFLGKEEVKRYSSVNEAIQAVAKLGIRTQTEYVKRYKEDRKLPSCPRKIYSDEWVSWFVFLKKERPKYYSTLTEASDIARSLDIKTGREYKARFKEDPKLHHSPHEFYVQEWTTWWDFLDTRIKKYRTLKKASKAAVKLGIKSAREYDNRYKEDPLLPASPEDFFSGEWTSFLDFLKIIYKYPLLSKASKVAIDLGITTRAEYRKRYREDPFLHGFPEKKYSSEWVDWYSFLNQKQPEIFNEGWLLAKKSYLKERQSNDVRESVLEKFHLYYFSDTKSTQYPSQLLHIDYKFNSSVYQSFVMSQSESQQRIHHHIMIDFFDWLLDEYCTDYNGEEYALLSGFRNPIRTILKGLDAFLKPRKPSESTKPVLPFTYIEKSRLFLFPHSASSFRGSVHLHEIFSADWFDVDKATINVSDLDCVWRIKPSTDTQYQIWCPARAIALYTLLKVPLRGQQILWLDSGEADKEIPVVNESDQIQWVNNTDNIFVINKQHRGFITKLSGGGEGMNVTTNKTSAREGGYSIPYIPHDLAVLIIRLRQWQEKYNPLKKLTPWGDITLPRKMNERVLKSRGKQAFLFRNPCDDKISPYKTAVTFGFYLPIVLYKIQSKENELSSRHEKINRYKSIYTPHSIRTSLITAYIIDGGVPIHVISKLVGHSSIVMTLYYTKVGVGYMRKELDEAEKRAMAQSSYRIEDMVLNNNIEQARGELIANESVFFRELNDSWPSASYQFSDKGICAMGGGSCDSGGINLDSSLETIPVPYGYLGRRNCVRCRYFITGPAFIGGLMALANELSLEIKTISYEHSIHEKEVQNLEDEKFDCESIDKPFMKKGDLSKAHSHFEEKAMKLDMFLCDYLSTNMLIKQSIALINKKDSKGSKQLIISESIGEIELKLEESNTDFRLLSEICENATIYASASASRALPRRSQMLDRLASINGLSPVMYSLTENQQLVVGNQLAKMLVSRANGWHDVDKLMAGDLLLDDLSENEALEPLSKSVESLLAQVEQYALKEGNY